MTTILDVQLFAHNDRLRGKVVLITGEGDVLQRVLFPTTFSLSSSLCRGCRWDRKRNCSAICQVKVRLCPWF